MGTKLGRLARLALAGSLLLLLAASAGPAARALLSGGCRPQNWVDWHVAMRRQCLSPAYVCRNMTTAKMLDDPSVSAGYREALEAGQDALPALSDLVGRLRETYGCEPERAAGPRGAPASRLPPGHPAVDFEPATSTTL